MLRYTTLSAAPKAPRSSRIAQLFVELPWCYASWRVSRFLSQALKWLLAAFRCGAGAAVATATALHRLRCTLSTPAIPSLLATTWVWPLAVSFFSHQSLILSFVTIDDSRTLLRLLQLAKLGQRDTRLRWPLVSPRRIPSTSPHSPLVCSLLLVGGVCGVRVCGWPAWPANQKPRSMLRTCPYQPSVVVVSAHLLPSCPLVLFRSSANQLLGKAADTALRHPHPFLHSGQLAIPPSTGWIAPSCR